MGDRACDSEWQWGWELEAESGFSVQLLMGSGVSQVSDATSVWGSGGLSEALLSRGVPSERMPGDPPHHPRSGTQKGKGSLSRIFQSLPLHKPGEAGVPAQSLRPGKGTDAIRLQLAMPRLTLASPPESV